MEAARLLAKRVYALLMETKDIRCRLHWMSVCLEAQGWDIWKKEPVNITIGGGTLLVMDCWLRCKDPHDGSLKESRAHWGRGTSKPSDLERILISIYDNMFRSLNKRWSYPSVLVNVYLEGATTGEELDKAEKKSRERSFDLSQRHAPQFQKSLREAG
jgi:hypothetical protein